MTRKRVLVLGAGASRSVSYANKVDYASPLDSDFFDLLQRRSVRPDPESDPESVQRDTEAIQGVLNRVRLLPADYWRSMERAFYTMHLRVYMAQKLGLDPVDDSDEALLADFARSVQALLRVAHGKKVCRHHRAFIKYLAHPDCIISFNYDLVVERALRLKWQNKSEFGPCIYGFADESGKYKGPLVLKLHGSSNWKVLSEDSEDGFEVRTKSWDDLSLTPGYRGHLGKGTRYPIFLPFWDKRIDEGAWLNLWKKAYNVLSKATDVIVWGYSLPFTDVKTQQLFLLALGEKQNFNLCVIDPSSTTRLRWRDLFKNALYWEYHTISEFFAHSPTWWPNAAE